MTRIVAGTAGGRIIRVPESGTRPTSDRVREAVFSRLEHLGVLDGARVLDLYAGSGALGLEAASRGAARVTLVESARGAAETCRVNALALGFRNISVAAERVERFLEHPVTSQSHLVFLDPPYTLTEKELAAVLSALVERLAARGVVVVERSGRSPEPTWPDEWRRMDERHYGDTVVWYAGPRTTVAA
jgi:16S rRNA (guanine966-N2)-methyltransferase